jgi:hypothetical protein
MLRLPPEILRRAADLLLEDLAEIFDIMEADHLRDLRQLQVGVLHEQLGLLDPDADDIIGEVDAVFLFELARDILAADIEFAGNLLQGEVGRIVLLDIFNNFGYRIPLFHLSVREHL